MKKLRVALFLLGILLALNLLGVCFWRTDVAFHDRHGPIAVALWANGAVLSFIAAVVCLLCANPFRGD
jgi:hypothetical protein